MNNIYKTLWNVKFRYPATMLKYINLMLTRRGYKIEDLDIIEKDEIKQLYVKFENDIHIVLIPITFQMLATVSNGQKKKLLDQLVLRIINNS